MLEYLVANKMLMKELAQVLKRQGRMMMKQ